tara:strand:+ start:893 stop:1180 length:288 start_codon:yes stop_codon:yes gene_type:complete
MTFRLTAQRRYQAFAIQGRLKGDKAISYRQDIAGGVAAANRSSEALDTLSWGKFGLQFFTVLAAFAIASAVPILLLGQSGLGLALSAFGSMGGHC